MSEICKCGSYAINNDPNHILCDKCWRDSRITELTAELQAAQERIKELEATIQSHHNTESTTKANLQSRVTALESENTHLKERNEEIHTDLMKYKLPHDEWQNVRNKAITATWQRCREIAEEIQNKYNINFRIPEAIEKEFTNVNKV